MRLVKPSFKFHPACSSKSHYENMVTVVSDASALCYKVDLSEKELEEREGYIQRRIKTGHESVLEHAVLTGIFTIDRGVTHEIVRHRIASFTQESTRYCNYASDKFGSHVTYVIPPWFDITPGVYERCRLPDIEEPDIEEEPPFELELAWRVGYVRVIPRGNVKNEWIIKLDSPEGNWFHQMWDSEYAYMRAVECFRQSPQEARNLLPHSVKADIFVTANVREWRHIFNLRALNKTGPAHPQMLEVMKPMLQHAVEKFPVFFQDLL